MLYHITASFLIIPPITDCWRYTFLESLEQMYHCFDNLRSSMATGESLDTSIISVFVCHSQDDCMKQYSQPPPARTRPKEV